MGEFAKRAWEVFEPGEWNETIYNVYSVIESALRTQSDALTLTPTYFVWKREGRPIGQFRIDGPRPTVSFRDTLEKILKRDELVRRHLHFVSETPEGVTYRVVPNEPHV